MYYSIYTFNYCICIFYVYSYNTFLFFTYFTIKNDILCVRRFQPNQRQLITYKQGTYEYLLTLISDKEKQLLLHNSFFYCTFAANFKTKVYGNN